MAINQNLALVTGGLGGIGSSIVEILVNRGDKVVIFDRAEENDSRVVAFKELNVGYIKMDIASVESIQKSFEILQRDFGGDNLSILVNNAGVTKDNLAIRLSESDWDFVLDVNLKGTFFCCQNGLKLMLKKKRGYIVSLSSIVGIEGNSAQTNYASSKAGIIALTKSLAKEYSSRNILINAIAPGFIETVMTGSLPDNIKKMALDRINLKRFGQPEDIANAVEFLTSGKADYINGEVIRIDGGLY